MFRLDIASPGSRLKVVCAIGELLRESIYCRNFQTAGRAIPFWPPCEDVRNLGSSGETMVKLIDVRVGIVSNHGAHNTKEFFEPISSKKANPETSIRIVDFGLRNTEKDVFNHQHNVDKELCWNESLSTSSTVQGNGEMSGCTKMFKLL